VITPPTHSRFARAHPRAYLAVHALLGFGLSVACAWIFFAIAEDVPENGLMVRIDTTVANWLQVHGTERGEAVFVVVSYFGAQVLIALLAVIAIALVVRRDWESLTLLGVTCAGGALLNAVLKTVFHRTRPPYAAEFHETSWSFPSAHAMNSLIVYGLLVYWLAERRASGAGRLFVGAATLVTAIGFARVYLGVHYLSDVLAGFGAGLTWLAVCITGNRFARRAQRVPGG
jgi:membrane-associated phospholipid phosphatase